MRKTLALASILSLSPTVALAAPDLCADAFLGPTGSPIEDSVGRQLARFCEWTNVHDVELWDAAVCCSIGTTASCTAADPYSRCSSGAKFYCEHAVESSTGAVTCQQAWADACDEGYCEVAPPGSTPTDTEPLCCPDGGSDFCSVVDIENPAPCGGEYVMCESPFSNVDGSVGCADDE